MNFFISDCKDTTNFDISNILLKKNQFFFIFFGQTTLLIHNIMIINIIPFHELSIA